jgi:hypothetical protein
VRAHGFHAQVQAVGDLGDGFSADHRRMCKLDSDRHVFCHINQWLIFFRFVHRTEREMDPYIARDGESGSGSV